MEIEFQSPDFPLAEALRKYVTWRFKSALNSRNWRIRRIEVRLSDISGSNGGNGKCCQIQVQLDQVPDILIKDIEADMYTAIDRAVGRTCRTLNRIVSKQHTMERATTKLTASPHGH